MRKRLPDEIEADANGSYRFLLSSATARKRIKARELARKTDDPPNPEGRLKRCAGEATSGYALRGFTRARLAHQEEGKIHLLSTVRH